MEGWRSKEFKNGKFLSIFRVILLAAFLILIFVFSYNTFILKDLKNPITDKPQAPADTAGQNTKQTSGKKNKKDDLKSNSSTDVVKTQAKEQSTLTSNVQDKPESVSDAKRQQAVNLYDQGLKLYYARDFNQALELFNRALQLDPGCYQALNGKGAAYAFLGKHTEGISLINQALFLKPDFEYAQFNLGLAYELAGSWDKAINAYEKAIKLDPQDAWAYYGIASIYGRQGNVEKTVEYLSKAIKIEPDAKQTAKTERDFDNVRNSSAFQDLLK